VVVVEVVVVVVGGPVVVVVKVVVAVGPLVVVVMELVVVVGACVVVVVVEVVDVVVEKRHGSEITHGPRAFTVHSEWLYCTQSLTLHCSLAVHIELFPEHPVHAMPSSVDQKHVMPDGQSASTEHR